MHKMKRVFPAEIYQIPEHRNAQAIISPDGNLSYSNAYLFKVLFDLKKPATYENGKATEAATSSTQKEQTTNDTRTSHAHYETADIRHGDSSERRLPSQRHLGNLRRRTQPLAVRGALRFRVGSERRLEEMLFCFEGRRFAALSLACLQYFRYARPCLFRQIRSL